MKNCFVIVNYNDYLTTYNLVKKIEKFTSINEIVIVDNASTDNSYNELSKFKNSKINILKNVSNRGYSSGLNLGCSYLIDKYKKCNIFISNPDIIIDSENVLKELIDTLKFDVSIVAPVIKEHEGLSRGWKLPTPWVDILSNIIFFHKKVKKKYLLYKDDYYDKDIVEVDAISGCFFLIRSDVLKQINFFDENVFLYYEENILGKKLENLGLKTVINTKVSVFHNHAVTINKNISRINKYKILKQSQMYFESEYNNANKFEIFMLWLTNKITLLIYKIFLK